MTEAQLVAFFEHYGRTLTGGDPGAVAACYVAPGMVLSDRGARVLPEIATVEQDFTGSTERYAKDGLVGAVPAIVSMEPLSEVLVSVDVHWDYVDVDGHSRVEDGYRYLMRATDRGPRIQVVISTPDRLRR